METGVASTIQVVLPGKVEPAGLEVRTVPVPRPGTGQVVLRMEATGVSFAEQQMRRGKYYDQPPFPFVPGYDLVGTVEQGALAGPAQVHLGAVADGADRAEHLDRDDGAHRVSARVSPAGPGRGPACRRRPSARGGRTR